MVFKWSRKSIQAKIDPKPPNLAAEPNIFSISRKAAMNLDKPVISDWLIEQGLTSAPTQYRLYGRRFLQVKKPNQQCQSTEGGWLVIQTVIQP